MTKFFTLSDARYFLGTVALINSIRITGHPEPIVVLDCGLTDAQRTLIDAECTIVPLPADARAAFASSFKAIAPLQHADDVVVLVDSDMVITRNVEELIAQATEGKFVAYPDPDVHRFFAEWEQIFRLPRAPRPAPYVNAGFMVFSTRLYPDLLARWSAACTLTAAQPTFADGAVGPASQADQDAINALLMSADPRIDVLVRPADEAPQKDPVIRGEIRLVDVGTLQCEYRATRCVLLHAAGHPKFWQRHAEWWLLDTAYTRLLRRLLAARDLAIQPPRRSLPRWLRGGSVGASYFRAIHVRNRVMRSLLWRMNLYEAFYRGMVPRVFHSGARRKDVSKAA